jgi:hypothetical protein
MEGSLGMKELYHDYRSSAHMRAHPQLQVYLWLLKRVDTDPLSRRGVKAYLHIPWVVFLPFWCEAVILLQDLLGSTLKLKAQS